MIVLFYCLKMLILMYFFMNDILHGSLQQKKGKIICQQNFDTFVQVLNYLDVSVFLHPNLTPNSIIIFLNVVIKINLLPRNLISKFMLLWQLIMKINCYVMNLTYIKWDLIQWTVNCFTATIAAVYIKMIFIIKLCTTETILKRIYIYIYIYIYTYNIYNIYIRYIYNWRRLMPKYFTMLYSL